MFDHNQNILSNYVVWKNLDPSMVKFKLKGTNDAPLVIVYSQNIFKISYEYSKCKLEKIIKKFVWPIYMLHYIIFQRCV